MSTTSTRDRILEAAAKLFVERGYTGTSVRDIASELGIANPSLYHHFASKSEILSELLRGPLETVQVAVTQAEALEGPERTRRIMEGLLESLEMHSGIALTALHAGSEIPESHRTLTEAAMPHVRDLLGSGVARDDRELRVTMAIGAVERAVIDLMRSSSSSDAFVSSLRTRRDSIIDLAMGLLS